MQVQHERDIGHPAARVWALLADFTRVDWLPGPASALGGEYEGRLARFLRPEAAAVPIIEFLLELG